MRKGNKIIAASMALVLILGNVLPAQAMEANDKEKEEVIYVGMDTSGQVTDINVVNIFGSGAVQDYGDYTSVKILNTTDEITQTGNKISFNSTADKVYYQGTMKPDTPIPWDIDIAYELNGEKISAEELAGKSGALKIYFDVSKNEACRGTFYDDFALQASFTLDTNRCSDIVAEGATMANVGSDRQINYTILPGKGINAEISANVTDFEMEAISINGIQLSLNFELDDEELMDKVREVMDATKRLNNGAGDLYDGASELSEGGSTLKDGMETLYSGVAELDDGIVSLQSGVANMQNGLNTLNSKSETLTSGSAEFLAALKLLQTTLSDVSVSTEQLKTLTDSSSAIKQGISDLYDGAVTLQNNLGYAQYKAAVKQASGGQLDIDTLIEGNTAAIGTLNAQISALQTSIEQLKSQDAYESSSELQTQAAQLEAQLASLSQVITLLTGNNAAINGVDTYLSALSDGVGELVDGASQLKTSYETFDKAINTLATNLSTLAASMTQLKTAVDTLVTEYGKIDKGITDYTDGVAKLVAGYKQIVKGVSSLASGSKSLLEGSDELKDGTSDLYDGIVELCDGSLELKDGTTEFYDKTDDMDTKVQDNIDEILDSIRGEDKEVVSFVNDENVNVASVQFVIKTSAIEKNEMEEVEEETEEQTGFWQKLRNLF
jgi:putative membrane protein